MEGIVTYDDYLYISKRRDLYSVDDFVFLVKWFGISDMFKTRSCQWMLSFNLNSDVISKMVDMYPHNEIDQLVTMAKSFDRDDQIKALVCKAVEKARDLVLSNTYTTTISKERDDFLTIL